MGHRIARALFRHRTVVAGLVLLLVGASLGLLPKVTFATLATFRDDTHAFRAELTRLEEHFVAGPLVNVVYRTPGARSSESRAFDRRISDLLLADPEVADVLSLSTIDADDWDHPVVTKNLLSDDGQTTAMVVRLACQDCSGVVDRLRRQLPEKVLMTGSPVAEADFAVYARRDGERFNPIVYLMVMVLTFLFTGRWRTVMGVGLVVICCQLVAMAALPLLNVEFSPLSAMLPPIAATLSAATCYHFLSEGRDDDGIETVARLLGPVSIAGLTTVAGFFALASSEVVAIREFGMVAVVAVLGTLAVTVAGMVIMWSLAPPSAWVAPHALARRGLLVSGLRRLCRAVVRRPGASALLGGTVLLLAAAGLPRLVVSEDVLGYFPAGSELRRGAAQLEADVAGTELLYLSIESTPGAFLQPEKLRALGRLTAAMEADAGVDATVSTLDYLKPLARRFTDRPKIPETAEQVEQLYLMNQDPRADEYLDLDRGWARVLVRTSVHDTRSLEILAGSLERMLRKAFPDDRVAVTGVSRLYAVSSRRVAATQVRSLVLAALVVAALLLLLFRSGSVGLLSLLPNVLPLAMVLGLLGWTETPLGIGTVMVCSIALGIAVDDTVHFVEQTRRGLELGWSIERSVEAAFAIKGPAIAWTSIVFSLGFLVIAWAEFVPVALFGLLVSLAMASAVLGDLVLLPAMILLFGARLGITSPRPAPLHAEGNLA